MTNVTNPVSPPPDGTDTFITGIQAYWDLLGGAAGHSIPAAGTAFTVTGAPFGFFTTYAQVRAR